MAAKVHFTNYRAGLEEFIAPDRIIKELDGDEDWKYEYKEPAEGENEAMKDTETRDRLLKARADLYGEFEAATRTWIRAADSEEGKQAKAEREQIAENCAQAIGPSIRISGLGRCTIGWGTSSLTERSTGTQRQTRSRSSSPTTTGLRHNTR